MKVVMFVMAIAYTSHLFPQQCQADEGKLSLDVLYLHRPKDSARTEAFRQFLSSRFAKCNSASRHGLDPRLLECADVVLLDWGQAEPRSSDVKSPLGPIDDWDVPVVLLGSAGLLQAKVWPIIGAAG